MKYIKNILFRILLTSLYGVILIVFPLQKSLAQSYTVADGNDQFFVISPAANSYVKGTIDIRFKAYDNNQSSIQYYAELQEPINCIDKSFGRINTSTVVNSDQTEHVFQWNTKTSVINSNLSDGSYCLEICAGMLNGINPYSVCNSRIVHVVNNNQPPVFTSKLSKVEYIEGENFKYQLSATDPNNDVLSYRFVATSNFLSINPTTGLISSISPLSTLGYGSLSYTVTVAVSDNKGGEAMQTFAFVIKKPVVITPNPGPNPNPNPQPGPEPEPNPEPTDEDINFTILYPKEGTVIVEKNAILKWITTTPNKINNIDIEYSSDNQTWFTITNDIDGDLNYYIWDASVLQDNDYYLKFKIEDTNGKIIEKVTPKLTLNLDQIDDNDNTEETSKPLIVNVKPVNDATLKTDFSIIISGDFIPSTDQTIDVSTASILLNGKDIKESCKVTEEAFLCTIQEKLAEGRQLVIASVKDSSDQEARFEWIFTIDDGDDSTTPIPTETTDGSIILLGQTVPRSVIVIGLVICGVLLALILIPWILYNLWRRGRVVQNTVTTRTITPNPYGLDNYYQPVSLGTFTPNALPTPPSQPINNYVYTPEPIVAPASFYEEPQKDEIPAYVPPTTSVTKIDEYNSAGQPQQVTTTTYTEPTATS